MALSGNQVAALGSRLRASSAPEPADVALLETVLIQFNQAMQEVAERLNSIGLKATTRLKSTGTIVDKLKRTSSNLKAMQDLAGARVVQPMTLDEQDAVASRIQSLWPNAPLIDRRAAPSYGYRAVHIVPRVRGCKVEVQLRTVYQDAWAQLMEAVADTFGRTIRYGGAPTEPDREFSSGLTCAEFVNLWITQSDELYRAEKCENEFARLAASGRRDSERGAELRHIIEDELGPLRRAIQSVYESLRTHGSSATSTVKP